MIGIVTMIGSAILLLAAGFHFYWGLGGRIGKAVSLPQREDGADAFRPSPAGTILVGACLVCATLVLLGATRLIDLPVAIFWLRTGAALLSTVFLLRALSWHRYFGFFKSVRSTTFAKYDTWFYSPACLFLAGNMAIAAFWANAG